MSASDEPASAGDYDGYLARFGELHGTVQLGTFVKHGGRLVKKLSRAEFEARYGEYDLVARQYFTSVDRGDTINDVAVKILRERASELMLDSPV